MMILRMMFYHDSSGKSFKQRLCHQVVEAEALKVEAYAIQKLLLPYPWLLRSFSNSTACC